MIHAINTSYHEKYEGKSTGFLQMATGKGYFEYSFAIHGYDDYTIKKKRSI